MQFIERQNNTFHYPHKRISSLKSLSLLLGFSISDLLFCASSPDSFYKKGPDIKKEDGSIRHTCYSEGLLESIQRKIKSKILEQVDYPFFLHGGIKGRSRKTNNEAHLHSKILIKEDIAHFFSSAKYDIVKNIWAYFFHFSPPVSELLTQLTTYKNELPQGVCTSSLLANLVFFRHVNKINEIQLKYNCTYTRYVDDITISSKRKLSLIEKYEIISIIYGMFFKEGFSPKRKKHKSENLSKRVELLGLTVNSGKLSISKQKRKQRRAEFHQFKLKVESGEYIPNFEHLYAHIRGIINDTAVFHSSWNRFKTELIQLRQYYYKSR